MTWRGMSEDICLCLAHTTHPYLFHLRTYAHACIIQFQPWNSSPVSCVYLPTEIDMPKTHHTPYTFTTTMADGNRFPLFLVLVVPETNPKPWIVVNNTVAISGCFLLADYWHAKDYGTSTEERPFATGFYIVWEFATCLLWVAESGLSASYQHLSLQQSLQWHTKLELWIAVHVTVSTAWMLCQWNLRAHDAKEIWSIVLDVSFYIYLAIRSCLCRGSTEQEGNQDESTTDDEDGGRSYQRMEIENDNSPSGALV